MVKLARSTAKSACSNGLGSRHRDLNPTPSFGREESGLASERGEYRVDPMGTWRAGVQGLDTPVLGTNTRVRRSANSEYWLLAEDEATGTAACTAYIDT